MLTVALMLSSTTSQPSGSLLRQSLGSLSPSPRCSSASSIATGSTSAPSTPSSATAPASLAAMLGGNSSSLATSFWEDCLTLMHQQQQQKHARVSRPEVGAEVGGGVSSPCHPGARPWSPEGRQQAAALDAPLEAVESPADTRFPRVHDRMTAGDIFLLTDPRSLVEGDLSSDCSSLE